MLHVYLVFFLDIYCMMSRKINTSVTDRIYWCIKEQSEVQADVFSI